MRPFISVLLLVLVVITGCTSPTPPPDYFALSARHGAIKAPAGPSVGLRPVTVPEYLRRSALVRRSQGHSISVSQNERWVEPLEDGIRRVLTLNIAHLLPSDDIRSYPWTSSSRPELTVSVDILELISDGQRVYLVAETAASRANSDLTGRLFNLSKPLTDDSGSELAAAYSDLLAELAELIVEQAAGTDQEAAVDNGGQS